MRHSTISTLPARRSSAVIAAAVVLATGALAIGSAASAQAATAPVASGNGSATAVVLRTGLEVSLLNNTARLPLNVSVNDVHAPADAHRSLLTARLNGVDGGKMFSVLRAEVATSHASADAHESQGYANLTHAVVHLPGLPLSGLVGVDAVTSSATCVVGEQPAAHITMAGNVTVLGQKVSVDARGATVVNVPGVGQVSLELAKKAITTSTAAATALELNVVVSPGQLNVATIKGTVTLAEATCQTPGTVGTGSSAGGTSAGDTGGAATSGGSSTGGSATAGSTSGDSSTGGSGTQTQTGSAPGKNLAETGGSSSTPYIAGAAAALVAAGGGVLYTSRRRRSQG